MAVGRVGRAHGVHGDVFVEPWTDAPEERFADGAVLHSEAGPLTVAYTRSHSGKLVVHFTGLEDRTAIEAIRGQILTVPAAARPPLADPDEFYDSDLVGLTARTADGVELGRVTDVVHGPVGDYLVLGIADNADGPVREHLVPFVAAIVPVVDVAGGTVTVDPPEGLFDL